MILCFGVSVVVQLYLKDTPSNFVLLAVVCALLVLSADWLFFYYMPGYAGAGERFLWVVLPSALMTAPPVSVKTLRQNRRFSTVWQKEKTGGC